MKFNVQCILVSYPPGGSYVCTMCVCTGVCVSLALVVYIQVEYESNTASILQA